MIKMSELPRDLLEEILCRIPAISLKRLRSTCKLWNRLLKDRRFLRKHFDKAAKQFLVLTLTKKFRVSLLSVNLHNGVPCVEVTGELSVIDHSNSNRVNIDQVFHCDGLLLCTIRQDDIIVVLNPCTGETKWIHTGKNRCFRNYALGYYQDKKSCNKSYKILSGYENDDQGFEIYDINSNSWRNLDVTPFPHYLHLYPYNHVFLKGKTYWFAYDGKEDQLGLISFDYTTERFERLHLPDRFYTYGSSSLSVVGEDKLSVLLHHTNKSRREIWITNKIDDETKEMSWSKLLEVEVSTGRDIWRGIPFLVDEEKKVVVSCDEGHNKRQPVITVSTVGADSNATRVYFPVTTMPLDWPVLVDYFPSLVQFQGPRVDGKRKRDE